MGAGEGVRPKPVSTMSLGAMSAAQLSPAEAVSMSALLDDCCEKLAFLGTISPDVTEHKMEESNRIGDEMSRIIAEQRQLEDKFEQLIQQRSELKASSNKKRAEENKEEIKEVARQLKLKTKLLCRNLKVGQGDRCAWLLLFVCVRVLTPLAAHRTTRTLRRI